MSLGDCEYLERSDDTVLQRIVIDGKVYETTYRVTSVTPLSQRFY